MILLFYKVFIFIITKGRYILQVAVYLCREEKKKKAFATAKNVRCKSFYFISNNHRNKADKDNMDNMDSMDMVD